MKKNLTHYTTQTTGTFLIQLPILASWLAGQPDKTDFIIKWMTIGTICLIVERIIFVHVFNYAIGKPRKYLYFGVVATIVFVISPTVHIVIPTIVKYFIWTPGYEPITWARIVERTFATFEAYLLYTAIYLLTHFWLEFQEEKEKTLKASLLAKEAQLKMLQYQINPHFLFNSLNAIQSMVEKDKDRAKEMVANLADFFRHTLSDKNQVFITLKEELDALQKYVSIQQERFIGKLKVCFEIDQSSLDIKIPSFLIHPLVENSIKYGFSSNQDMLEILVKTEILDNNFTVAVKNSGSLKTDNKNTPGTKTGIANIKKRLLLLYPDNHEFELSEENNWVTAKITIYNIVK